MQLQDQVHLLFRLVAESTERAKVLFLSIHSANKQFFEIGKV